MDIQGDIERLKKMLRTIDPKLEIAFMEWGDGLLDVCCESWEQMSDETFLTLKAFGGGMIKAWNIAHNYK